MIVWFHDGFVPCSSFFVRFRFLRELDLQENEIEDHSNYWLSCFPENCTSLISLNFACLRGEVNLGALERLVARSPNLISLRLNRAVPLETLQNLLLRAPQLIDLGTGSFIHDRDSEIYDSLKDTILKCQSLRSLSGFLDVSPRCLTCIYPICSNLTSLNLSYAPGLQSGELIKVIEHCENLQRLWVRSSNLPLQYKPLYVYDFTCMILNDKKCSWAMSTDSGWYWGQRTGSCCFNL